MSIQDLPHREPPLRIWQIQTWSIQLLSPTKPPLHKRQGTTTITSTYLGPIRFLYGLVQASRDKSLTFGKIYQLRLEIRLIGSICT